MQEHIEELFLFLLEHCLWQFPSRAWDREDNINGVCEDLSNLLTGKQVLLETPDDKCNYANSRILAEQIKKRFPWMIELSDDERKALIEGVHDKLMSIAVTNSRNLELNNENY